MKNLGTSFDDATIREIFGAEAAEDENPERLKAYFFKNKTYQNMRLDLPLRILVGHKGIGKSALLKMSFIEDADQNILSIWIQPNDLAFENIKTENFVERIEAWKRQLSRIILKKSLDHVGVSDDGVAYGFQISAKRIVSQITSRFIEKLGADPDDFQKPIIDSFLGSPIIRIYIDDIDRGWAATHDDIQNISALINAARDLSKSLTRKELSGIRGL